MLANLFHPAKHYSLDSSSDEIFKDVEQAAIPTMEQNSDRVTILNRLLSDQPSHWPTMGYSYRIRIVPVLFAYLDRIDEAREAVSRFRLEAPDKDQLRPNFDEFAELAT